MDRRELEVLALKCAVSEEVRTVWYHVAREIREVRARHPLAALYAFGALLDVVERREEGRAVLWSAGIQWWRKRIASLLASQPGNERARETRVFLDDATQDLCLLLREVCRG